MSLKKLFTYGLHLHITKFGLQTLIKKTLKSLCEFNSIHKDIA